MFIRWSIFGLLVNYKKYTDTDTKKEKIQIYSLHDRLNDYIPNNIKKIEIDEKYIPIGQNISLHSGYDLRHIGNENDTDIIIKIEKHFMKMRLLRYLETNQNLPDADKLLSITKYNKQEYGSQYEPNIKKGGLYKDWDFVF